MPVRVRPRAPRQHRLSMVMPNQCIIFGNFGNETIALIQWAHQQALRQVKIIHVETGWSEPMWEKRVQKGRILAESYGFESIALKPVKTFAELLQEKGSFPNPKFQWCATLLKGVTINHWLNEHDPYGKFTIYLPHTSKPQDISTAQNLYGERELDYPLSTLKLTTMKTLVADTDFPWLTHRSLECAPCIHSNRQDFQAISLQSIRKVVRMEKNIKTCMFPTTGVHQQHLIAHLRQQKKNQPKTSYATIGCGSNWACGM